VTEDLKTKLGKQRDDAVLVLVIILKIFLVGAASYLASFVLAYVMNTFSGGASKEALEFFDVCVGAGTYLIVGVKDLVEYAFK
jgi:hypothetical protein